MSHQNEDFSDEKQDRVQVDDLPQEQEDLQPEEAKNIKGGGGASGGMLRDRQHIGEEIPQ